jgi:hypothetical protein
MGLLTLYWILITVDDWKLAVRESPKLGACYYFGQSLPS